MIMLLLLGLSVIAFITFFRRQNPLPRVQTVRYQPSSLQISVIRDSATFFKASAADPAVPAAKTVASK
uniref:Uncharacterized protein n=1 Tax=Panagrolaimus davidi TaxID=227884 RepID=A0A914PJH0_9BILA